MKLSLKAKKPPLQTYQAWIAEKKAEQERTAKERVKLLPPDLAEQIMRAADREIELLQSEEAAIHQELASLQAQLKAARARQRAACLPTNRPGAFVQTEKAAELGREVNAIARQIKACQFRLADIGKRRLEIRAVQRAAAKGTKSAILAVVQDWRNKVVLGPDVLPEAARMGRVWTDAAGNPLPPEALGEDGQPIDLTGGETRL